MKTDKTVITLIEPGEKCYENGSCDRNLQGKLKTLKTPGLVKNYRADTGENCRWKIVLGMYILERRQNDLLWLLNLPIDSPEAEFPRLRFAGST